MPTSATEYDCRTCGACCACGYTVLAEGIDHPDEESLIEVLPTGEVAMRWADPGRVATSKWTGQTREGVFGRCIALEGIVGESVRCTIYEGRPTVCSGFPPGPENPSCRWSRQRLGLEPPEGDVEP